MKKYTVVVLTDAKEDLRRYIGYLQNVKKNTQAAKNVMDDYKETRNRLAVLAGSLREPDNEKLKKLGLKRINFLRHDYFMLYKIEGNKVIIIKIFHALEDFENKIK